MYRRARAPALGARQRGAGRARGAVGPRAQLRTQRPLTQDADEQTVRNDYSAFFVDSGLQVPPGAWIQNPGVRGRFAEYVA